MITKEAQLLFARGFQVKHASSEDLAKYNQLANSLGISPFFRQRLPNFEGKEYVFLLDDSSSMKSKDV